MPQRACQRPWLNPIPMGHRAGTKAVAALEAVAVDKAAVGAAEAPVGKLEAVEARTAEARAEAGDNSPAG